MEQVSSVAWLRGLSARAIVWLLLGVAVAAVVAYAVFTPRIERTFTAELGKRGNMMTTILAQHQVLRLAMVLKNANDANALAQALYEGDSDIRYVLFVDDKGNVIGGKAAGNEASLKQIADAHLLAGPSDLSSARASDVLRFSQDLVRGDSGGGADFAPEDQPARSKVLGRILLGLSATNAQGNLTQQTLVTIVVTALILTLVFLVFFTRITQRVQRIVRFAARIAGGDLTARVDDSGADEIGLLSVSLAEMAEKTSAMVARMQEAATAVARAASEILSSSSQQGQASTRQATAVAQAGATVAELRETFNQAAERAQAVIDLAKKSEESTSSGKSSVQESVAAMEQIRDQVLTISRTMMGLVDRTNQISAIIDVVNDLAEQSYVLALNAAIEAAKAGEQGRGFAVVAREVRSLAERSKDSTAQVRSILQDIERASRDALGVIDEGTRKTHAGLQLATRAGDSIVVLDRAINESSTAAKQIAASTRQQAVGVEEIWQAMKEIDRAVNETASGIRQLEGASKNMKGLSDQMATLVEQYRVTRAQAPTVR
jgi:methyl-accepting chemotaxis protein